MRFCPTTGIANVSPPALPVLPPPTMRGTNRETGKLFSYGSLENLVPQDHPLRAIRALVNAALDRLSPTSERMYAEEGRSSIALERLLRPCCGRAIHHPPRTAIDAADRQQHAIPLGRRAGEGRAGLERDGVH
jgi:hypothetical protein